ADYRIAPNTLAGFALAGGGTNFSVGNGLGSGRSDLFQAGAYARHTMGAAYVAAALAYGWQDVTTNRTVTLAGLDQLQARFHDYANDRSIGATFQSLPGASFVVNGAAQQADKALTTLAAELVWRNGLSLAGTFDGEFSGNSSSYTGKAVARYQW